MLAALRNRDLALLASGGFVSSLGDWLLIIALPFDVYQLTHSALATGTTFLVRIIPSILLGPVAGVLVDRWDRRRTMIVADLARASLLLPLLTFQSERDLLVLYTVAAGQSLFGSFFGPAKGALVPRLRPEQDLTATNSLLGIGDEFAMLVGAPLGGAIFALLGLSGAVLLDSGSFLVSALMIALIRPPAPPREVNPPRGQAIQTWRATLSGLGQVWKIPMLRGVLVSEATEMVGQGVIVVLWVVFFQSVLHGDAIAYGTVQTAVGLGTVTGGLLFGWLGTRIPSRLAVGVGGLAVGVCLLGTFAAPQLLGKTTLDVSLFALILALQTVGGIPAMWRAVATRTLVQESAADSFRGRAFGILGSVSSLSLLVGTILASALGGSLAVATLLDLAAILFGVAGLVALVMLPEGGR